MEDHIKLELEALVSEQFLEEKKFLKVSVKFFSLLDKLKDLDASEENKQYSFVISEGKIHAKALKLKNWNSRLKLTKALKYLQKHIDYKKSTTIGSVYISHNQIEMNLIAVDNKIYYSVYQVNEEKKEQLVQDLDGNHIVFRIDDGNMEVTQDVLEINVSFAHFDLTKKDQL
ncbi:hypothetical protein [Bacillus cereus group sp. BfR-BA-01329]|uniref:hypothetical protein n=1 Tax=Bacillus cereus group sp. BfR-BA-01329 TaxID=2920305 RepID=UPI001F56FCF8|nr:hypothetical protein [Bacillus cereus group sp. BfR-BA-01329]